MLVVIVEGLQITLSFLFLISSPLVLFDRTYDLKAESLTDAEAWVAALRHTQVSGVPLADQILTNSSVPIIVHKCLQFVESTGFDTVGLYSINGGKAKIRKLILAFNQGKLLPVRAQASRVK